MFLQNYITTANLDNKSLIQRLAELGKPQENFILANINDFKQG